MTDDVPQESWRRAENPTLAGDTHPPVHTIQDLVVFRLSQLVAVLERAGGAWAMREFGLSLNEWRVLGLTYALSPVRTGRIAEELLMDKGQLSRLVRGLVEKGYLRNRVDDQDGRASLLELTEPGLVVHDQLLAHAVSRNERAVDVFDRKECEMLMNLVSRLYDHVVLRVEEQIPGILSNSGEDGDLD